MELGPAFLSARLRKRPLSAARNKINLSGKKEQHIVATSSKSTAKEAPLVKVTKEKADHFAELFFFLETEVPRRGSTSVYSSQATNTKA